MVTNCVVQLQIYGTVKQNQCQTTKLLIYGHSNSYQSALINGYQWLSIIRAIRNTIRFLNFGTNGKLFLCVPILTTLW